ncbi:claudin-23-like [Electrophorus electricus]|uniref:claudin-23-like n=1 Tax=Electrophorus electricus TaxID=8005 RepID=UPI0015D03E74|nr:claudin-23-like [Electrophorus electricus]
MRTPGILIFGLVFSPCGWILDLTSTVATNWRTLNNIAGQSSDTVVNQGIWDICNTFTTSTQVNCNLRSTDTVYFSNQIIPIAQGMMVASLIVTAFGLAFVTPAARCWTNQKPRWVLASMGGLLIFCSGVLTIIPIAWYTHLLPNLNTSTTFINPQNRDIRVGYCIVLGYIGGIMEVLAGIVIFIGICKCCGGRNRGEYPQTRPPRTTTRPVRPTPHPRVNVPRSISSISSSSVPYSRNTLDDDLDFPRAKGHHGKGTVNPSYSGRPYDADL